VFDAVPLKTGLILSPSSRIGENYDELTEVKARNPIDASKKKKKHCVEP